MLRVTTQFLYKRYLEILLEVLSPQISKKAVNKIMYLSKSIGSPLFAHTNASEDWLVLTGEEIPYFGGLMQEVFFSWLSLKFSCTNLVWLVRKYWICRKNCNRIVIWNLLMKLHMRLQCSEFIKWYSSCTGTKSHTGTKVCICMHVCVCACLPPFHSTPSKPGQCNGWH